MRKYALVILFLLSLVACKQLDSEKTIRFAVAQAPLNLDPRYATDAASERVNRLLYRALVDFDEHAKPQADLAKWQMITPTKYRFTLQNNGRTFHNGSTLNAADVAATYQSLLALKDAPNRAEFSNVSEIQVLNADTVEFYLSQADADFPSKLIIGILPKSLIERHHDFSHHPIGSGDLKWVSLDNSLKLKRIKDGQLFSLIEVKDPTVRVLKLVRGEIDLLQGDLPPELVHYLKQQNQLKVLKSVGANYSYLGLNFSDPILNNVKVREAIAHAINRPAIIQYAMIGGTREATAILPPEHWAGNAALKSYNYNPQLARQLLEQAGVKLPLKLTYKTSTDAQRVRLATIMQAQMREAGIELKISSLDWGTFFQDVKQGNFQLYGLTWVGIKTPEIYAKAFHSKNTPPDGFNRGRFANSQVDALLDKQDWQAATTLIHEQLPYIPLWYEGQFAAMRKDLKYYNPKPDGNWDDLKTVMP